MSALDKVLAAAARPESSRAVQAPEPGAGDLLVAAARSAMADLYLLLAGKPDSEDDDSDDDADNDKDSDDHTGHATYKAMVKKGMPPGAATKACASADRKRVAATALASGVLVALSGLAAAPGDWVEATALDPRDSLSLLLAGNAPGDGSKPYGDVAYADPGYQQDGKKRYPIDTADHAKAAWAYISKPKNQEPYSSGDLAKVIAAIKGACRKLGIDTGGDAASDQKMAATALALASGWGAAGGSGAVSMDHGSHTGFHKHAHRTMAMHEHGHFHNGDSDHSGHAHGANDNTAAVASPGGMRSGW